MYDSSSVSQLSPDASSSVAGLSTDDSSSVAELSPDDFSSTPIFSFSVAPSISVMLSSSSSIFNGSVVLGWANLLHQFLRLIISRFLRSFHNLRLTEASL